MEHTYTHWSKFMATPRCSSMSSGRGLGWHACTARTMTCVPFCCLFPWEAHYQNRFSTSWITGSPTLPPSTIGRSSSAGTASDASRHESFTRPSDDGSHDAACFTSYEAADGIDSPAFRRCCSSSAATPYDLLYNQNSPPSSSFIPTRYWLVLCGSNIDVRQPSVRLQHGRPVRLLALGSPADRTL
jgi:hypothetical protein